MTDLLVEICYRNNVCLDQWIGKGFGKAMFIGFEP